MIVYLDSSALVKLFVCESGTEPVQRIAASSRVQVTSEPAYVEIRSALARREREGTIDRSDFSALLREFDEAWSGFFLIPLDRHPLHEAGDLEQGHRLRAYDAIHLAAGLRWRRGRGSPPRLLVLIGRSSRRRPPSICTGSKSSNLKGRESPFTWVLRRRLCR